MKLRIFCSVLTFAFLWFYIPMQFKELQLNPGDECNCLENAIEDIQTSFGRAVNFNKIRIADFKTYWEKDKDKFEKKPCYSICTAKGISISKIVSNEEKEKVIQNYIAFFNCLNIKNTYYYLG